MLYNTYAFDIENSFRKLNVGLLLGFLLSIRNAFVLKVRVNFRVCGVLLRERASPISRRFSNSNNDPRIFGIFDFQRDLICFVQRFRSLANLPCQSQIQLIYIQFSRFLPNTQFIRNFFLFLDFLRYVIVLFPIYIPEPSQQQSRGTGRGGGGKRACSRAQILKRSPFGVHRNDLIIPIKDRQYTCNELHMYPCLYLKRG